jgi:hypothetical protein
VVEVAAAGDDRGGHGDIGEIDVWYFLVTRFPAGARLDV